MKRSVNEFRKEVGVAKVHRKPGFKILFKKLKSGLMNLDIVEMTIFMSILLNSA